MSSSSSGTALLPSQRKYKRYTDDQRKTAIANVLERFMSIKETAQVMNIKPSTISTWVSKFEEGTGESAASCSTPKCLTDEHKEELLCWVNAHPLATLHKHAAHLADVFDGFVVSKSTIDCFF